MTYQRLMRCAGIDAQRPADRRESRAPRRDQCSAPEKAKRIAGAIAASMVVPCD
jgi:hypothetical protein